MARDVRRGGVVEERFHGGVGERGTGGGRESRRGRRRRSGVDEGENESEREEGDEKEKPQTVRSSSLLVNGGMEKYELRIAITITLHLSFRGRETGRVAAEDGGSELESEFYLFSSQRIFPEFLQILFRFVTNLKTSDEMPIERIKDGGSCKWAHLDWRWWSPPHKEATPLFPLYHSF